ncbi:MAG TPA: flagellar basal body rod protein FlgC [Steroidobacteraceae bacterium]|nr:flagellar basal body rod protein FlgC [Steroidobacteraceae bacterium]
MGLLRIFDVAGSAMAAQSMRLNIVASNLANAESVSGSPATVYRSRHPVFAVQQFDAGADPTSAGVRMLGVVASTSPPVTRYEPDNPLADAQGQVYASSVSPVEEMADMISASRSYQSNLAVLETSRDLIVKTLSLGH